MKKPPEIETRLNPVVTVLSVSRVAEDQASLRDIFRQSEWPLCPGFTWRLNSRPTLDLASPDLRRGLIPVVLYGCDQDGEWREKLEQLKVLPCPPLLILFSRLADDRLWAEALNLGAHDVLAKPFDGAEVTRVVSVAWLYWKSRYEVAPRVMRGAA